MAKPELGTKRLCPGCGAKYYDLNRDPIACPKCGTAFEAVMTSRAAKVAKVEETVEDDEDEDLETPELVTLEEADAESEGGDDDVPDLDDDEVDLDDDDADDDVFIDDEDEDDESIPGVHVDMEEDPDR